MNRTHRQFVEAVAGTIDLPEPIYEFGSYQVKGQEQIANLRDIFPPGIEFVGTDMRHGPGVDRVMDLHNLPLPDSSVGTALCIATLEHVREPWTASNEIYRVLKPDGIAVISSVFAHRIHDYPDDYWRFTAEAFDVLLGQFDFAWTSQAGPSRTPHTIVGIGGKNCDLPWPRTVKDALDKWKRNNYRTKSLPRRLFRAIQGELK